jgi:hypothetical protein
VEQEEMLRAMAKLTLANSQQIRALQGCLFITYLAPADSNLVTEPKKALQQYYEAIRGQRGHTRGPPAVHALGGLLDALVENDPNDPTLAALHKWICAEDRSWRQVTALFPHTRVQPIGARTLADNSTSLQFATIEISIYSLHPETLLDLSGPALAIALEKLLTTHVLKVQHASKEVGPPPPKRLERVLQRMLD